MGQRSYRLVNCRKVIGEVDYFLKRVRSDEFYLGTSNTKQKELPMPKDNDEQLELIGYIEDEVYRISNDEYESETSSGVEVTRSLKYVTDCGRYSYSLVAGSSYYYLMVKTNDGSEGPTDEKDTAVQLTISPDHMEEFIEFLKEAFSEIRQCKNEGL